MLDRTLTAPAPRPQARALFLYSPVGGGHLQASRAAADAWLDAWPGTAIQQLDYLQFMPACERRLWPGLYNLALRRWPALWRGYRRWTNRPGEPSFIRNRVTHVGVDRFAALLEATRPRLVVSTIGGAAALAGAARERLGRSHAAFVNALVMTDFRAHRHWARPEADLLFVASEEAKADVVARGIPPQRVLVVGIPVDPGLRPCTPAEQTRLRGRLGVGLDGRPVLLISSGAGSVYRALDRLLSALADLGRPMDVVTSGGPAGGVENIGAMRLFRLGLRDDFCTWMAASDLVVGKLGGHTAAQAFATGVPLVVFAPIPGQEEDNARWAVAAGAAVWPRTRAALQDTVVDLLYGGAGRVQRRRMSHAARSLARPGAALEIARVLKGALEAQA
jgi:processive 1,2-diacylglycerol beta-glucosyltransferase